HFVRWSYTRNAAAPPEQPSRCGRVLGVRSRETGESIAAGEPRFDGVTNHLAINGRDGFGKRDSLRANLHAILRVVAIFDAAGAHERIKALVRVHRARRMHVEEAHLADDGRADEVGVLVYLRTYFEA